MVYVVLTFLFVSIFFYLIFAGADFGAGILELFSSKQNKTITQNLTYKVIGPVWEANHVWLILVMVILWVGFPAYFNLVIVQLHIPFTLLLIGIIGRGTAFIFRHYDAYHEEKPQKIYNTVFQISSFFTPFIIGIIGGALISGNMHSASQVLTLDFGAAYIAPWLNGTALSTGLFATGICAFISSVFLIGEAEDNASKILFRKRSIRALRLMVLSGALVFGFNFLSGGKLVQSYLTDWHVLTMLAASGLILLLLYKNLNRSGNIWWTRILAVTELIFVLGAMDNTYFSKLNNY